MVRIARSTCRRWSTAENVAGECASVCDAWKSDAEARRAWHAYHLIGDVLRSEDLVSSADHDRGFLTTLQARLAAEPVVFAPAPLLSSAGSAREAARATTRSRWMMSSAAAAGFVLVIGTFVVLGPNGPMSASRPVSVAAGKPAGVGDAGLERASLVTSSVSQPIVVNSRMLRDASLDRYLAAHKQFAGTSALGVPSAFLRSATVDVEQR